MDPPFFFLSLTTHGQIVTKVVEIIVVIDLVYAMDARNFV